jgi:hypothetical protein
MNTPEDLLRFAERVNEQAQSHGLQWAWCSGSQRGAGVKPFRKKSGGCSTEKRSPVHENSFRDGTDG